MQQGCYWLGPALQGLCCLRTCTACAVNTQLLTRPPCLPSQVANEIWEVKGGAVTKWKGDIVGYKQHLKATHEALQKRTDLK